MCLTYIDRLLLPFLELLFYRCPWFLLGFLVGWKLDQTELCLGPRGDLVMEDLLNEFNQTGCSSEVGRKNQPTLLITTKKGSCGNQPPPTRCTLDLVQPLSILSENHSTWVMVPDYHHLGNSKVVLATEVNAYPYNEE